MGRIGNKYLVLSRRFLTLNPENVDVSRTDEAQPAAETLHLPSKMMTEPGAPPCATDKLRDFRNILDTIPHQIRQSELEIEKMGHGVAAL